MKLYVPLIAACIIVIGIFAFVPGIDYDVRDADSVPLIKHYTVTSKESADGLGGTLYFVKHDAAGNVLLEGNTHNQVVNTGEEFLLDQLFQDATTTADNNQIGAICISDAGAITVAETETAADFDGDNGMTETNCKEDTAVTTSGGTGVIGPLTFTCGGTNCADGDTITGIAICQVTVADDNDFNDCATNGIMFSVIDITPDVTLNAGETVDITYTFDVTTASS